jgi:Mor family transcriptional regulator
MSLTAIAKHFGITKQRASQVLKERGRQPKAERKADLRRRKDEARADLLAGASAEQVAGRYNITPTTARKLAKAAEAQRDREDRARRLKDMLADWQAGANLRQLSAKYGWAPRTVQALLPRQKPFRSRVRGESARQRDREIMDRAGRGATAEELAAEFNLATGTVYNLLHFWRDEDMRRRNLEIAAEHAQGAAVADLAARHGLSENTVYKILSLCRNPLYNPEARGAGES